MTRLEGIEQAITELTDEERAELRRWLDDYDFRQWDRQIAADDAGGKLDHLIAEAFADHEVIRLPRQ